jgi:hypothetical protein
MTHYAKFKFAATALPPSLLVFCVRYYSKVIFLSPATQYVAEIVRSFEGGQIFYSTAGAIWYLGPVVIPNIQETCVVLLIGHKVIPGNEKDPILLQRIYTLNNNR